jgi:putative ABC transport system ATP-binding protein
MLFEIKNAGYKDGVQSVLEQKTLSVAAGRHLLLLGASGCGKTTLMNIMAGLLRPNSGEVLFDGVSYSTLSDHGLDRLRAANFGFVFQKIHLIGHLSVAQNIALAQMQTKPDFARVQTLITELGLSGKENQKARDLSVGEAQRVAIARAVANNPKVIFADEPTSALDDENASKVMDLIFAQAEKTMQR